MANPNWVKGVSGNPGGKRLPTNEAQLKWRSAICRALARAADGDYGSKLNELADVLVKAALSGDIAAIKEIGNRIDGTPISAPAWYDGDDGDKGPTLRLLHPTDAAL